MEAGETLGAHSIVCLGSFCKAKPSRAGLMRSRGRFSGPPIDVHPSAEEAHSLPARGRDVQQYSAFCLGIADLATVIADT